MEFRVLPTRVANFRRAIRLQLTRGSFTIERMKMLVLLLFFVMGAYFGIVYERERVRLEVAKAALAADRAGWLTDIYLPDPTRSPYGTWAWGKASGLDNLTIYDNTFYNPWVVDPKLDCFAVPRDSRCLEPVHQQGQ